MKSNKQFYIFVLRGKTIIKTNYSLLISKVQSISSILLEALPVSNRRPSLFILSLRHPHLLYGAAE